MNFVEKEAMKFILSLVEDDTEDEEVEVVDLTQD